MHQQKSSYSLSSTKWRLLGSASAASVLFSFGAAYAQSADAGGGSGTGLETVVVTSTRLQQAGYSAPTPTTFTEPILNPASNCSNTEGSCRRSICSPTRS